MIDTPLSWLSLNEIARLFYKHNYPAAADNGSGKGRARQEHPDRAATWH
jgi:hypothetical protein